MLDLCAQASRLDVLALSLAEAGGVAGAAEHLGLLHTLESVGRIDRTEAGLPDETGIAARLKGGRGFTRPELAVLMAAEKTRLRADLAASARLDDLYLVRELNAAFPPRLVDEYPQAVSDHRPRRDIIASGLANAMVQRGGIGFADRLGRATSLDAGTLALAFVVARDAFRIEELNRLVDLQEAHLPGAAQVELYRRIARLAQRATLFAVRNAAFDRPLGELVQHFTDGLDDVRSLLPRRSPAASPKPRRRAARRSRPWACRATSPGASRNCPT